MRDFVLLSDHLKVVEEIESLRARLKEKDETLQELQTKLAEAEKDAERYRRLIDALVDNEAWAYDLVESMYDTPSISADKVIDAAIANESNTRSE